MQLSVRLYSLASLVTINLLAFISGNSVAQGHAEPTGDLIESKQRIAHNLESQPSPKMPLSTADRYIVDSTGKRFKLKSVNWYGPHVAKQVVEGLNFQTLNYIVQIIKEYGFNSVRLPFSNAMLHDSSPVDSKWLKANPQLVGLTPLQIFDETVRALTEAGIVVILNNHTTLSEWCCIYDYNGLWHHTGSTRAYNQNSQMWQDDWLFLIDRYKNNPLVAGVDLRNEVRTARLGDTHLPDMPNWGRGDDNDWNKAAEELGNKILLRNPNLLIIVEGINWWGTIPMLGSGERPHLKPVRSLPIHLNLPNKLVYAAHNYAFIGPRHTGDSRNSRGNITYGEMDEETFRKTITEEWSYILTAQQYYTAPIWLSEFGVPHTNPSENERVWFSRIVDFLIQNDVDFAYWPLNHEDFGLINEDWSRPRAGDWRDELLQKLLNFGGYSDTVNLSHVTDLSIKSSDDDQSTLGLDWLPGAIKGTCPDIDRLLGVSSGYRGLCSNINFQETWSKNILSVQAVHESESISHQVEDWAPGLTKYRCPTQFYATGFTKHRWGTSGILCAASQEKLSDECRTLWFDHQDSRSSSHGGDWAHDQLKGQCGDNEYIGGLGQKRGKASAILCCRIRVEP